jgi:hypothetical protein
MISIITGLRRSGNFKVWALAACAGLLTLACDKLPLLAPQESTITLSSGNSIVQANGTTEIRATVLEQSGTPVQNGTTVTFTTNLGTLSPGESRTLNGVASVQFLGNGQSGKASIKAISGGAASDALEISVGAAAAGRVSVTANPTSVPSTGGTTTVTAVVVDASGNPLGGVPITFSTTAGSLSSQVVTADSGGRASTNLNTSREAIVTATVGSGSLSATVTIAISARPTVAISLATGSIPVEGGITTFSITANTGTGGAPLQNVVVNYGDGSSDDLGAVSGTVSVQHIYGDDGSFTPSVTATDTSGASASASTVIVVQPLLVSITATKTGVANQVTLAANISPVGSSIASYAWTFGDGTTQTTSGNSTTKTYAGVGTYTVRVTARTSTNHSVTATTSVTFP